MIKRRSNMRLMSRGWLLFMLLLAAAAPGCKKKAPPPPPTPQVAPLPMKPQSGQAVAPANAVQPKLSSAKKTVGTAAVQKQMSSQRLRPTTGVSLDFTSRRDPFRPYIQAPAAQSAAGKVSRSRVKDPLPIQSFDTERFKVSGIVTGLKQNSALVVDPTGKGYVVKEGMPLGNNDGYVKRVTNTTVEVEESFRDDNGRLRKRLVKLTLIRKK